MLRLMLALRQQFLLPGKLRLRALIEVSMTEEQLDYRSKTLDDVIKESEEAEAESAQRDSGE
ncbi:hypothetical protein NUBL21985_54450 [Klebsiella pneumoniae]|nr:hypothetical protein NUBL21985_54450 [Klebsiella pneumoniae]